MYPALWIAATGLAVEDNISALNALCPSDSDCRITKVQKSPSKKGKKKEKTFSFTEKEMVPARASPSPIMT